MMMAMKGKKGGFGKGGKMPFGMPDFGPYCLPAKGGGKGKGKKGKGKKGKKGKGKKGS